MLLTYYSEYLSLHVAHVLHTAPWGTKLSILIIRTAVIGTFLSLVVRHTNSDITVPDKQTTVTS